MDRATIRALLFGVAAAFFSGTHSVIVRYLADHVHGATIAVLRVYVASAILFLILKSYKRPTEIKWTDKTLLITVCGFAANFVVFHWGLEYTGASSAMVLENTAPVFVLLIMALVLRERIRALEVLGTFLVLFGVYFTVRQDFELGPAGVFGDELELFAGLTWAVFLIGSSRALLGTADTFERLQFLFAVLVWSSVLLTPILFIFALSLSMMDIVLIVLLGIFPTAIAYYLWYETAARVSPVMTSLLFTLTVIFTFVNAYIFLGEAVTADMLIGAGMIVAGVLISKKPSDKSEASTAD